VKRSGKKAPCSTATIMPSSVEGVGNGYIFDSGPFYSEEGRKRKFSLMAAILPLASEPAVAFFRRLFIR